MKPNSNQPPYIFDMRKRQAKFNRANQRLYKMNITHFLWDHMANEFCERLAAITREFENVLIIGSMTHYQNKLVASGKNAIHSNANITIANNSVTEDIIPYHPKQFDLIITAGALDSVNDLPGALVQIQRILKPDGMILGSIFGSGSLATLKSIMMVADGDAVRAHIHPQIDIRTMADLLVRAGFKLPVADRDTLNIRYSSLMSLVNDIRDMGVGNNLAQDTPPYGKASLFKAMEKWHMLEEADGKVSEIVELIHFNGWAPSSNQPQPAKRGSAKISLANALKSKM